MRLKHENPGQEYNSEWPISNKQEGGTLEMSRRLPVYLLLDTSGSMTGDPIQAVGDGVKTLVADLKTDPQAQETAYLSVITFDNVATQVTPLTEIGMFQEPALAARGRTAMGEALKLLLDCYNKEIIKNTSASQKGDYKPLVFLLSDGHPTDDWEKVADEIGAKVRSNKMFAKFVALAAGSNADTAVLKRLTDDVLVTHELKPDALKAYFKWVTQSIVETSRSVDAGAGEYLKLPPPPASIEIVP
jgi:uncharacterized protein YegL